MDVFKKTDKLSILVTHTSTAKVYVVLLLLDNTKVFTKITSNVLYIDFAVSAMCFAEISQERYVFVLVKLRSSWFRLDLLL